MRRRVLIYRALGLGDLLTALPALRVIDRAFPDHDKEIAAPAWLRPLVLHAGAADRVLPSAPLARLDAAANDPDVAINLHGRGPQSHRILLATRPRRLLAFAHPNVLESADGPTWRPREHEVHRWCRMLAWYGIDADPDDLYIDPPAGDLRAGVPGATVIHPGAASRSRRWPVNRWAALARNEIEAGREVIVTGGPDEVDLARTVAGRAGCPDCARYAGTTDVLDLAGLVASAGRVLCTDTGIAHLATALRVPSIVLFGPTSPEEWGPPADARHRVLWGGGTGDPHGAVPDPGLLQITVDDVLRELDRLPARMDGWKEAV